MTKKSTIFFIMIIFLFVQLVIFLDMSSSSKKVSKKTTEYETETVENRSMEPENNYVQQEFVHEKNSAEDEMARMQEQEMQMAQQQPQPEPPKNTVIYDRKYKEALVNSAQNMLSIENMGSIMGPEQLRAFIKKYDSRASIYNPTSVNFRANLHTQTISSNGQMAIEELLSKAQEYSDEIGKLFYIAITDHNNIDSAKRAAEIVSSTPDQYKNVRVILGMGVFCNYFNREQMYSPVKVHLLVLGINPYDSFFAQNNFMSGGDGLTVDSSGQNYSFSDLVKKLQSKGYVGIAYPAAIIDKGNLKVPVEDFYRTLFETYLSANSHNFSFIEGYYQSYTNSAELKLVDTIRRIAKDASIYSIGGTDVQGNSIFKK